MQLNHLNLSVKDVPATRGLFETYFDFQCTDTKPNETLSVLTGANGFLLVLMHEKLNENGHHTYPDAFHIGFYLDNREEVSAMYTRLQKGGISVGQPPQAIRKTFGFYFVYDTFMIEITTPLKD